MEADISFLSRRTVLGAGAAVTGAFLAAAAAQPAGAAARAAGRGTPADPSGRLEIGANAGWFTAVQAAVPAATCRRVYYPEYNYVPPSWQAGPSVSRAMVSIRPIPADHAPGAHSHAAPVPAHERPLRPDPVHAPVEHAAVAGAGHGLVRPRHLRLAGVPLPARPDRRPRPAVPAAEPVARGDPTRVTPARPGAEHLRDQLQPPGAPAQVVRGAGPLAEPQRRPELADLLERRPEGGRPVAAARPGGYQGSAARVVAASVRRASAGPRKCS